MSSVISSGRIHLLDRVAELAKRQGLQPLEADARLRIVTDANGNPVEVLELDDMLCPEENRAKFERLIAMLGCDESGVLRGNNLLEIAQAVERAIDLSPRVRSL